MGAPWMRLEMNQVIWQCHLLHRQCNLSSLRICVSRCMLLALIRLSSVPVSSMKTCSGNNPSTDIAMGEVGNFLGFIITTLHSTGSISWVSIIISIILYHHSPYLARAHSKSICWSRGFSRVSRRIIRELFYWRLRNSSISCPIFLQ